MLKFWHVAFLPTVLDLLYFILFYFPTESLFFFQFQNPKQNIVLQLLESKVIFLMSLFGKLDYFF